MNYYLHSLMSPVKAFFCKSAIAFLCLFPSLLFGVNHNPESDDEERQSDIAFQTVPTEIQASSDGSFTVDWTISTSNVGDDGDGVSDGYEVVIEEACSDVCTTPPKTISSTSTSDSSSESTDDWGSCKINLVLKGDDGSGDFVEVDRKDGIKIVMGDTSGSGGSNGSVHYFYGLGSVAEGRSGGRLLIEAEDPSEMLFGPEGIHVTADPAIIIYPTSGTFSQALSDNYLTSIHVVSSEEYEIRSYLRSKVNNLGSNPNGPWTVDDDDSYFKRTIVTNPGAREIDGTDDDTLYHSERVGESFSYALSQTNGDYLLKLHFVENFHDADSQRAFDVTETDTGTPGAVYTLLDDFDVYFEAGGKHTAIVETFPITITDGSIDLDFVNELYQATVSAIEVVKPGETEITATVDDELFHSERWGDDFSYAVSMANGDYEVELGFVERYYDADGARTFDVKAEGATQLNDYDIYNEAGALDKAVVETFPVTVSGGTLNLEFTQVDGPARLAYIKVIGDPGGTPYVEAAINVGGSSYTASDSTAFSADTGFTGGLADSAHGVLTAINAGGTEFTATNNTVFSADANFSGGKDFYSGSTGIRFTEKAEGPSGDITEVYEFSWLTDPISGEFGECVLKSGWYDDGGSDAFLKSDGKLVEWSQDRTTYVETRTIRDHNDQLVSKVEEHYEVFPFGEKLIERIVDPDTAALSTTWEYYEGPEIPQGSMPDGYARKKRMDRYDGYWEEYKYDGTGRITEVTSPYADGTDNKVVSTTYSESNPTVTKVTKIDGVEVARSYEAEFEYATEKEYEKLDIVATESGAAWDATSNLVTKTRRYMSSYVNPDPLITGKAATVRAGQLKWKLRPDGTATYYDYELDGSDLIKTTLTGVPEFDNDAEPFIELEVVGIPDEGIQFTQITNSDGEIIEEERVDIDSNLVLWSWTATQWDEQGRVTKKTYGDGTALLHKYPIL